MTALQREVKRMRSNDIRLRVIGDISPFPQKLQDRIHASERATAEGKRLVLQVAANYGGRWEIVETARKLAQAASDGQIDAADIDEKLFAHATTLGDLPDPDLFIRTGGDLRISNFLLWHCAYTEFYFTPVLWPDFDADELGKAITDFQTRQRRYGRTGAQLTAAD